MDIEQVRGLEHRDGAWLVRTADGAQHRVEGDLYVWSKNFSRGVFYGWGYSGRWEGGSGTIGRPLPDNVDLPKLYDYLVGWSQPGKHNLYCGALPFHVEGIGLSSSSSSPSTSPSR
jgi:hypothetical protein